MLSPQGRAQKPLKILIYKKIFNLCFSPETLEEEFYGLSKMKGFSELLSPVVTGGSLLNVSGFILLILVSLEVSTQTSS